MKTKDSRSTSDRRMGLGGNGKRIDLKTVKKQFQTLIKLVKNGTWRGNGEEKVGEERVTLLAI